jgi:hypothetical protein
LGEFDLVDPEGRIDPASALSHLTGFCEKPQRSPSQIEKNDI